MKKSDVFQLARELRKKQTDSEKLLWEILRNRQLNGFKFYRQRPIFYSYYRRPLFFIADFYCPKAKLVIELDGKIHELSKEYDEQRDTIISNLGIKILRFKNDELNNTNEILKIILQHLE